MSPVLQSVPLGQGPWPTPNPFLFCVHHVDAYPRGNAELGPAASLAGRDMGQDFGGKDGWSMYHGRAVPGFPQHPHRGFETVTVVRRGLVDHSDSLGATARYGQGDVQWLTAGAGVNHAEMFPLLDSENDNPAELFQIWLNLPRASKRARPHFTMFWAEQLPHVRTPGVDVLVVAGALDGTAPLAPPPESYASARESDVAIWTASLDDGATWTLPTARPGTSRVLYNFGRAPLSVGGTRLAPAHAAVVDVSSPAEVRAQGAGAGCLVLQGRPIDEPVVQYGPFVMNSREEIAEAFSDYQRTQFGGWPWKRDDPVHPRDQGRFAQFPDGTLLRPPAP